MAIMIIILNDMIIIIIIIQGTGRLLFNVPPAGAGGAACGASDGGEACDCVCWNSGGTTCLTQAFFRSGE